MRNFSAKHMELHDQDCLKSPIAPVEYRQTYRAFELQGFMLNSPPGHRLQRHFEQQDFPNVELQRDSLATCNVQHEDAGYGFFMLKGSLRRQQLQQKSIKAGPEPTPKYVHSHE